MNEVVVFDVVESGYRQWAFSAFGLIFVAIGTVLVLIRHRILHGPAAFFPFLFLGFALLWTISSFVVTFFDYRNLAEALQNGRCQIVEGKVTNFDPMPYSGHKKESFAVEGHRFAYSDYELTAGFNQTRSHGGPISNGTYVRIHYNGDRIARLEVVPGS